MKLIKLNQSQISENKEVPGLVNCRVEYEMKTAKGRLDYHGPKFAPEMWHQVLSFFRWTHKEMQSECQVRLYVNLKLGRWAAWAFPQAARTGMTARELPEQETPDKARERFAFWNSEPSDDWLYFGTVHHHCAASAFQSATDEQNEWNQDGLHLTAGKMEAERHDLHARFYLGGNCYEPDLGSFWSLDPELAAQIPSSMHDELARYQMCGKVTVDFPEAWRMNLVENKTEQHLLAPSQHWGLDEGELRVPLEFRLDDALEEIGHRCAVMGVRDEQWLAELNTLTSSDVLQVIIGVCIKHEVMPEDLFVAASQTLPEY